MRFINKTHKSPKHKKRTTRKNKKTSNYKSKKQMGGNPQWEESASKVQELYNNKQYTFIIVPENTYLYRGYTYGYAPYKNDSVEDIQEIEDMNREQYEKRSKGIFYGNLGVACYYSFNPDQGSLLYHNVQEYRTNQPIKILDMSVWQNIKNIIDDSVEINNNMEHAENILGIFNSTYSFEETKKKIKRDSNGDDTEMIEIILTWLKLTTHPPLNGFGCISIPGFHSEIAITDNSLLTLTNEYSSNNFKERRLTNIRNPADFIALDDITFMSDNNKKPFKITTLLQPLPKTRRV